MDIFKTSCNIIKNLFYSHLIELWGLQTNLELILVQIYQYINLLSNWSISHHTLNLNKDKTRSLTNKKESLWWCYNIHYMYRVSQKNLSGFLRKTILNFKISCISTLFKNEISKSYNKKDTGQAIFVKLLVPKSSKNIFFCIFCRYPLKFDLTFHKCRIYGLNFYHKISPKFHIFWGRTCSLKYVLIELALPNLSLIYICIS